MATVSLADIPDGTAVFIDANVFIYHFSGPTPLSPACSAFLSRVEEGRLRGVTFTLVLIEVLHRLMILEAIGAFQLQPREAPYRVVDLTILVYSPPMGGAGKGTFWGSRMAADIFTLREVARYLKVTERTIYRLVAKQQIPGFKVGGSWRFRQGDLDRWIRSRVQGGGASRGPLIRSNSRGTSVGATMGATR